MSIEKDIQQQKFRNEYHKTVVNLIFTYKWITEKTKQFFEKGDITSQQYNILRILRGAGKPLSTLQIRQRMLDKMSDTSRIVDRLVKKELVQKQNKWKRNCLYLSLNKCKLYKTELLYSLGSNKT